MQVKCPGCKSAYKIDDHRIPKDGMKMRCPKCQTAFKVVKKTSSEPLSAIASDTEKSDPPGISPKRPTRSTSSVPAPAMPSIPMPEPPMFKKPPPSPPPEETKNIAAAPPPNVSKDNGKIELATPPKVPESGRDTAVTGEFDPLTENLEDLELDDSDLEIDDSDDDLSFISEPPNAAPPGKPVPPSRPSAKPPLPSPTQARRPAAKPLAGEKIDATHDPRGELISLPPDDSLPPLDSDFIELDEDLSDSVSDFDITEESPDKNPPQRPSLALIENNIISTRSTPPPPLAEEDFNKTDFSEIDFDSTLSKSDAFGMHHTEDLDLEAVDEREAEAKGRDSTPSDFGDIGIPSLEPDRPTAPPTAPISNAGPGNSLPPALAEFDLDDDTDLNAIPSPADLLNDDEPPDTGVGRAPADRVDASGSTDFGEVDLQPDTTDADAALDLEDASEDGAEFDAFPTKKESNESPSDSRIDLADEPAAIRVDPAAFDRDTLPGPDADRRPEKSFKGRRKLERQNRRIKIALLALLVCIVAGGASLSFTTYGPFGADYLFRLIPKATDKTVVAAIEKNAQTAVQRDTYDALTQAIEEARKGFSEYTASEDLQLLTVYLCYLKEIRFGVDAATDALATRVLGSTDLNTSTSRHAPLAKIAQYIRFARNVSPDAALRSALERTSNGLGLLARLYLSSQNLNAALAAASDLDQKEHSARSGYLLNTIRLRLGDETHLIAATTALNELHRKYAGHPGITLLLAEVLISAKTGDEQVATSLVDTLLKEKSGAILPRHRAQAHAIKAMLAFKRREYNTAQTEVAAAEKLNPDNLTMSVIKGRLALRRKDFSTADLSFNKVLAEQPDNTAVRLYKIETDIGSGELSKTQTALTQILDKDKQNAYANYLLGEILVRLRDTDNAVKHLTTAIRLDDTLLEAYIALSNLYISIDNSQKAMETLDAASEKFTDSSLIKKTLASAYGAQGDFPAAIVELDNALKLDPEDVEAHYLMAQMYREMKDFDDALKALTEVEKRNPEYPGLALEQGRVLEFSGNVAKALSSYKKALSQTPSDTNLKLRVAVASHLIGDTETARKELISVLADVPASPEANFYYGETHRIAGTAAEAISYLKKACDLDPQNPLYLLRYGQALMDVNDNEKAMTALEEAIRLDSKLAEGYIAIGKIRLLQGGPRDAIYWIQKGLSIDPNNREGYLVVAEAYEQIAKPASAVHYYRKAADIDPENATIQFKLGLSELLVEGYPAAASTLTRAVALAEKKDGPKPKWYPEALYRLGMAEKKRGQRNAAIAAFQKYLKMAPENDIDRSEVQANLDDLIN